MDFSLIMLVIVVLSFLWIFVKKLPANESTRRISLKNKVVLITGASSGLGKACCFAFQKYGCKVVLCSRNVEDLEKVKLQLEEKNTKLHEIAQPPAVFKLDVTDIENVGKTIRNIVEHCDGKIDILINNAGLSQKGSVLATNTDVFRRIFNVNLLGQIAVTKAVLPFMVAQGSGHIVGIGSVQSKIAVPLRAAYSASKHASQGFYDALRPEIHQYNIQVTTVNPSYIKTNISKNALVGDGSQYGKTDSNIQSGMDVEYAADQVVNSVVKQHKDEMIAPVHHKIAVWIRFLFPDLYFWIMRKRAGL